MRVNESNESNENDESNEIECGAVQLGILEDSPVDSLLGLGKLSAFSNNALTGSHTADNCQ